MEKLNDFAYKFIEFINNYYFPWIFGILLVLVFIINILMIKIDNFNKIPNERYIKAVERKLKKITKKTRG